jgi:hypothetical protein
MNTHQAAKTRIEHEIAKPEWRSSGLAERHDTSAAIHFRRFCILPGARILLADGCPVPLGSRAFDLLLVLVQGAWDGRDEGGHRPAGMALNHR